MSKGEIKWTKKKSGTWSCSFLTQFGRRTVNTKLTDKREAVRQARQVRIIMRSAHRFEAKVGQMFSTGRLVKLKDARDEWLSSLEREGVQERTLYNYRVQLNAWMTLTKLTDEQVCVVTEDHVNRWVNGNDKAKGSTRNKRLILLRMFMKFCMFKSYHPGNPAMIVRKVNMSKLSHAQKEPKRKVPFTDEEIQKLITHIDEALAKEQADLDAMTANQQAVLPRGHDLKQRIEWLKFWRCAVVIGRYAGLRIGDIAGLEHASITPVSLCVWTDKKDKRVEIPLNDEMRRALHHMPNLPVTEGSFCFPFHQKLNAGPRRAQLSDHFSKLLERCGIKDRSFHCTRSACAVDLLDRLIATGRTRDEALEIVRAHLGHGSCNTTEKYYTGMEKP